MLEIIAFSCPILIAAAGALFSEYAGILALFLEGLISLSGFFTFLFADLTGNIAAGIIISSVASSLLCFCFSRLIERTKANPFIAALALNLLFSSLVSFLSFIVYHTRGVLTSPDFAFPVFKVQIFSILITCILIIAAICFLQLTPQGLIFRITGSNPDVLEAKGHNSSLYRSLSWAITGFFAAISGSLLVLRISSFVPGISSSKGWIGLAIVFLGRKKLWKMALFAVIFCAADYLAANIQNYFTGIPSSLLLAFPYLIVLMLIALDKK